MMLMEVLDKPSGVEVCSRTLWARGGKRMFDIIASLILLVGLAPLLALTSLLIKATSRGPVFFSQIRGGWQGKPFRLYKFRTMRGDRKLDVKELVPLDHPEITPLGRVLRRFKIDELPQLWHVLSGEMSLIGPRPTLLDQIEAYDDFRRQRLLRKPGQCGHAIARHLEHDAESNRGIAGYTTNYHSDRWDYLSESSKSSPAVRI